MIVVLEILLSSPEYIMVLCGNVHIPKHIHLLFFNSSPTPHPLKFTLLQTYVLLYVVKFVGEFALREHQLKEYSCQGRTVLH